MRLGAKLKRLRKEKKLTLDELSKEAGVARALISRIENGHTLGSFKAHEKLCKGLGITSRELYQGTEILEGEILSSETVHREKEAEQFTYDEKTSSYILTAGVKRKNMLPQLLVLKPGGQTHEEENPYRTEKFLFGLEGELEVRVAGKTFLLKKEGSLYFKSSYPHQIKNIGHTEAKCLCVTSPVAL